MDICVWPDGTWCYKEDLPEMTHMSDDYCYIYLPDNITYDEIDEYVSSFLSY